MIINYDGSFLHYLVISKFFFSLFRTKLFNYLVKSCQTTMIFLNTALQQTGLSCKLKNKQDNLYRRKLRGKHQSCLNETLTQLFLKKKRNPNTARLGTLNRSPCQTFLAPLVQRHQARYILSLDSTQTCNLTAISTPLNQIIILSSCGSLSY